MYRNVLLSIKFKKRISIRFNKRIGLKKKKKSFGGWRYRLYW